MLVAGKLPAQLLAARAADGLLLLNPAEFAFAYIPTLTTHRAQDTAFCDLLTEALQQLFLGFVRTQ